MLNHMNEGTQLHITAKLLPQMGDRFQPTGFPDLGAATYTAYREQGSEVVEIPMLIVESEQSIANRLEAVCWDEVTEGLIEPLQGIPYIRVCKPDGEFLTSSILEAHRLASAYILKSKMPQGASPSDEPVKDPETVLQYLAGLLNVENGYNRRALFPLLATMDLCSLLHGVFLAQPTLCGGRFKVQRAISGCIDAEQVRCCTSGGVKLDHVDPTGKQHAGTAADGYGHIPYYRDEYTAARIAARFSIDLAQIRGYGLNAATTKLLHVLALFKIRMFLDSGLRLRTSCDLKCASVVGSIDEREELELPSADELTAEIGKALEVFHANQPFAREVLSVVFDIPRKAPAKKGQEEQAAN